MKIGLSFYPVRMDFIGPMVRRADDLGYESCWIGEHLAFPSRYGAAAPFDLKTPLVDPLITLAFVAAQTRRMKVGTSVYIAPLRPPIVAAKLASSLDVLSGGRVLLGLGSGWLRHEFDAIGMPWEHRGARLEEAVHVMRRLWTEERVAHHGRFYHFEEIAFEPKPAQRPLPILLGGETPAALGRAARIADGWVGLVHTPQSAAAVVRELRRLGAADRAFEFTVAAKGVPTLDDLRRFAEAGVHRVNVVAHALAGEVRTAEAALDGLERLAEAVISKLES
jgi:probable F420-dependent oxidoreductase